MFQPHEVLFRGQCLNCAAAQYCSQRMTTNVGYGKIEYTYSDLGTKCACLVSDAGVTRLAWRLESVVVRLVARQLLRVSYLMVCHSLLALLGLLALCDKSLSAGFARCARAEWWISTTTMHAQELHTPVSRNGRCPDRSLGSA